jgi:hypothetical protein
MTPPCSDSYAGGVGLRGGLKVGGKPTRAKSAHDNFFLAAPRERASALSMGGMGGMDY